MQPHDTLGVAPDADLETIKRAYFERAKSMHPDAGGSDKEFVELHAAYEAMTGGGNPRTATRDPKADNNSTAQQWRNSKPKDQGWRREDHNGRAREGEQQTREDQAEQPFVDVLREARARLEQETAERLARGTRPQGSSMVGFWIGLILTPVCAAGTATCLCYDGQPLDRPLWTFSFAVALGVLIHTGGLAAAVGAPLGTCGPILYRRVVILLTIITLLIALPWSTIRNRHAQPRPLITRHHVPDWWPD